MLHFFFFFLKAFLRNVDLRSVPDENLASLVSCVNMTCEIQNVKNCNIILASVKSKHLYILNQNLTSEETRTLVKAMESKVETVGLGHYVGHYLGGSVTLDMAALAQYSGQGKCEAVYCGQIFFDKYEAELRSWVNRMIDCKLEEPTMNPSQLYCLCMRWSFKTFCRVANFVLPFPIF